MHANQDDIRSREIGKEVNERLSREDIRFTLQHNEGKRATMSKMFDEIMQGMQEIVEFEQGKRTLRVDKILVVPMKDFTPEEILSIRKAVSLSQRSFASVIGVSPKTVEAWEAGTNKPSGASSRMLQLIREKPDITREFYSCTARV